MMGVEVIALVISGIWLVGGGYVMLKRLMRPTPANIGVLLAWLLGLVVLITYAEQHDDPWEQYVANGMTILGSAAGGFLAALMVVREKVRSLGQRLDDHCNSDTKLFNQFEKRMDERFEQLEKHIIGKMDSMTRPKKV
jgi:hypothetical protein